MDIIESIILKDIDFLNANEVAIYNGPRIMKSYCLLNDASKD
jgi:hypothetical protein